MLFPKITMACVARFFFDSYNSFVRISADNLQYVGRINHIVWSWNVVQKQLWSSLDCHTNLSSKECFVHEMVNFQYSQISVSSIVCIWVNFSQFNMNISYKKHSFKLKFVEQADSNYSYLWTIFQLQIMWFILRTHFEFSAEILIEQL